MAVCGLAALGWVRLPAVWRAWESLRLDPAIGIARWLRDVADPQMDRLRNPDEGPFVACGDRHLLPPALPLSPTLGASGPAPRTATPAPKATMSSTWAGCRLVKSSVRQPGPARATARRFGT